MNSASNVRRENLFASTLALSIAIVAVAVGLWYCQRLERRYIHALAPELTTTKLQGIALQKEAFAQPDLLVLYGSSELASKVSNNAARFFLDYPTGFRVFSVGKPGTTSLSVLQKLAALGPEVEGKKFAFSISPGWFFIEKIDPKYYEGNFSELQASELIFSSRLSWDLKRDVARRMRDFPKTLEDRWVLGTAVDLLADDTRLGRALYAGLRPLGELQSAIGRVQDHFEAGINILDRDEELNEAVRSSNRRFLNWKEILRGAAKLVNAPAIKAKRNEVARNRPKTSRDKVFVQTLAKAKEWSDLDLLLRTMKELKVNPLLLSMPVEDIRLELYGVSPETREAYHQKLSGLTHQYQFPLLPFREHEKDPAFMVDFHDHLSDEGWLYYNKALDDFFHGRISSL